MGSGPLGSDSAAGSTAPAGSLGVAGSAMPVGDPVPLPPGPPRLDPATTGFPPAVANPGVVPVGPGFPPPVANPGDPFGVALPLRPADSKPPVRLRRVAGVALWACVLAFGGLVVGGTAFVKILAHAPGWFEPVVVAVGLIGIGLTAAAFPTVRHRSLPWVLLGSATVALIVAAILAISVG